LRYNSPKTAQELERSPDPLAAIGGLRLRRAKRGGDGTGGEVRGGGRPTHECGLATGMLYLGLDFMPR